MPLYEYICRECDTYFTSFRSVADHNRPCYCPECTSPANKILSAPNLSIMKKELRFAHETNERSAHEPKTRHGHTCGAHCNHDQRESKPAFRQQPRQRPWMLGH